VSGMLAARDRAAGTAARAAILRGDVAAETLDRPAVDATPKPAMPRAPAPRPAPTSRPAATGPAPSAAPPTAPAAPAQPPADAAADTLARLRDAKRRARGG
jgi:hypothetical protein